MWSTSRFPRLRPAWSSCRCVPRARAVPAASLCCSTLAHVPCTSCCTSPACRHPMFSREALHVVFNLIPCFCFSSLLQERLEAAERAGAGEEERYQHTTAELHEQLEQQASELVECQHRCVCSGHKRRCSSLTAHTAHLSMSKRTDSQHLCPCCSCQQGVRAGFQSCIAAPCMHA
jgi:hypothetical protein